MKKVLKKLILILVILMILFSINAKVFAWSEIIRDGQAFIKKADKDETLINEDGLKDVSGYLYNILLAAGVIISVIVATVLGVQFIIGGAEGQAKVKEMLVPYVIGCIVVFGGFGFWKIAIEIGKKIDTTSSTIQPYERDDEGNPICSNCGDKLEPGEQRQGKCFQCGATTGV